MVNLMFPTQCEYALPSGGVRAAVPCSMLQKKPSCHWRSPYVAKFLVFPDNKPLGGCPYREYRVSIPTDELKVSLWLSVWQKKGLGG